MGRRITVAHNGTDTSRAAAAAISPHASNLRERVLGMIRAAPLTCDEIEHLAGLTHQTASARVNELKARNLIVDSGLRRNTRSGRKATVWKLASQV